MQIETLCTDFFKVFGTDAVTADYQTTAIIPSATKPAKSATRGIIEITDTGVNVPNNFLIVPYGTGADNATITGVRVFGWKPVRGNANASTPTRDLWIPVPLFGFVPTLCAAVGVAATGGLAAAALTSTYRFCDTITLTSGFGTAGVSNDILSPGSDLVGYAIMDFRGFNLIEFDVDLGTATAANFLIAKL